MTPPAALAASSRDLGGGSGVRLSARPYDSSPRLNTLMPITRTDATTTDDGALLFHASPKAKWPISVPMIANNSQAAIGFRGPRFNQATPETSQCEVFDAPSSGIRGLTPRERRSCRRSWRRASRPPCRRARRRRHRLLQSRPGDCLLRTPPWRVLAPAHKTKSRP